MVAPDMKVLGVEFPINSINLSIRCESLAMADEY
jgi:hypothetical protein